MATIAPSSVMTGNDLADQGSVLTVCFSSDGTQLASAGHSGIIQMLDVASGEKVQELVGQESISSVCFSPRGELLASAERRDAVIRLWELSRGTEVRVLHVQHFGGVNALAFSCDGGVLLAAYGNVLPDQEASGPTGTTKLGSNALMVWNLLERPGSLRLQIGDGHNGAVTSITSSPVSSRFAASASIDGTIKIWDIYDGKEEACLVGHGGAVWSLCYSPNGKLLASASSDRCIKLWSTRSRHCILTITGHTKVVTGVQFTGDGTKVISCSSDRTVRLWDVETRGELACAEGDGAFTSVSISRMMNVAVGCASGELYLLDMSESSEVLPSQDSPHTPPLPHSTPPWASALAQTAGMSPGPLPKSAFTAYETTTTAHNTGPAQHAAASGSDSHARAGVSLTLAGSPALPPHPAGTSESVVGPAKFKSGARFEDHPMVKAVAVAAEIEGMQRQQQMALEEERKRLEKEKNEFLWKEAERLKEEMLTELKAMAEKLSQEKEAQMTKLQTEKEQALEQHKTSLEDGHRLEMERLRLEAEQSVEKVRVEAETEISRAKEMLEETVKKLKAAEADLQMEEVKRVKEAGAAERERLLKIGKEEEEKETAAAVDKFNKDREQVISDLKESLVKELERERVVLIQQLQGDKAKMAKQLQEELGGEKAWQEVQEEERKRWEKEKERLVLEVAEEEKKKLAAESERRLRELREEETKRLETEREHIVAHLRETFKVELDKALASAAQEHEHARSQDLLKLEAESKEEADKAMDRTKRELAARLVSALEHAKDAHEKELQRQLDEELAAVKAKHDAAAAEKLQQEKEKHDAETAVTLIRASIQWKEEMKRSVKERIEQDKAQLVGSEPPALPDLREVFESTAARHVYYTMQLVRDWACLEEGENEIRALYDDFKKQQHAALNTVRELYVSQLQHMAEALLTRTPPAPVELIDIVERTMKAVVTAHKNTPKRTAVGGDDGMKLLMDIESVDADKWIRECAKDELDTKQMAQEMAVQRKNESLSHTNGDAGEEHVELLLDGVRTEDERARARHSESLTRMIQALKVAPGTSLASALTSVRKEMASDMADLLMENGAANGVGRGVVNGASEPFAKEPHDNAHMYDATSARGAGAHSKVQKFAFPRRAQNDEDEYLVLRGSSRLQSTTSPRYNQSNSMGSHLTERFRYLEPSPAASRGATGRGTRRYDVSPRLTPRLHLDQQSYASLTPRDDIIDQDHAARSEARLQVPFWMRHHKQIPVDSKRAAANVKRERKAMQHAEATAFGPAYEREAAEHMEMLQHMQDERMRDEERARQHEDLASLLAAPREGLHAHMHGHELQGGVTVLLGEEEEEEDSSRWLDALVARNTEDSVTGSPPLVKSSRLC